MGYLGGSVVKNLPCQCRRLRTLRFNPWVRKIPGRRKWQPTQVFLPGKCHGQRNLVGSGVEPLESMEWKRVGHDLATKPPLRYNIIHE